MRGIPLSAILSLVAIAAATARGTRDAGTVPAQETPVAPVETAPSPTPAVEQAEPLDAAERTALLRLAWRTLTGHLTNHPIQDSELEQYDLTPRLLAPRGCFVTLLKGAEARGNQGEIDPTRPLYQQVILFTRRAATRDPRFLPVTQHDLGAILVRIEVIGARRRVESAAGIASGDLGVFLEKWGRRALFLPGIAAAARWSPERTLDELCRQAALPGGAWKEGARIETFATEVVEGPQPQPVATPSPSPSAAASPSGGP